MTNGGRRAPFAECRWNGDVPQTPIEGHWCEIVEIDGIAVSDIVKFCKENWRGLRLRRKHFEEDLVDVLAKMDHEVGETVDLKVKRLDTGEVRVVKSVPMTGENRQALWWARKARTNPEFAADIRLSLEEFARKSAEKAALKALRELLEEDEQVAPAETGPADGAPADGAPADEDDVF